MNFSTINGKDSIKLEAHTPAFDELKADKKALIKWKVKDLPNRSYDFIIGVDLLKSLNCIINLEQGTVILNRQILKLENKPYIFNEIHTLEPVEPNLENLNLNHLNEEEYVEINKLIKKFRKLFFKEGDKLSSTTAIEHEIITTTDQAINAKLYRFPPQHEEEVRRQVREMEEQGIIRKSNSRYASPLIVIPKKIDNSGKKKFRIVVDYRKLNEITVDDKFPLPNIDAILDKLGKAQYFSTIDLAKGYHQILINEEDKKKTAFVTPHGLYEFNRMPFGLKNAPATFQRLMNEILRDHINRTCVVYLDDILIFSTTLQEHVRAITEIFTILEKHNLKIQTDKCNFMKKETEFLGHILTEEGLKPNPGKIKVIQSLTIPTTQRQIKSFLGLTGYYRKFVKDYAKVAQPITKYLRKNMKINTKDPNYIDAFEKLKNLITSHPILKYPNFEKSFVLTTDASNYAIGAFLSQEGHPVSFASRTLNQHEQNYSATDKEFLAIIWAVNYFRPYLYGKKFKILTDHLPIKYLQAKYNGKDISPRHQRWLLKLGEYHFDIEYLKGKENKVADFLSRIEHKDETDEKGEYKNEIDKNTNINEEDSSNFGLFNIENESNSEAMATVHSAEEELLEHIPIKEEIVNKYRTQIILTNNKTVEIETILGRRIIYIAEHDFERLGEIFKKYIAIGKIGIFSELSDSKYNEVQQKLIELYSNNRKIKFIRCSYRAHELKTETEAVKQISLYHVRESFHSGIQETYNNIKNKIYYPKLLELIQIVINQCEVCQTVKYDRKPIKPKFEISETPSNINEIVHIDTYVIMRHVFLTIIDKFSKFGTAYYMNDRNYITILEKLEQHFTQIGKPQKIIADNEFKAIQIRELLNNEGISLHLTKPNSHTGNGDIERFHNSIAEKFRILKVNKNNFSVQILIQQAIRNYNNRYHSTIKCTPNEVQNRQVDFEKIKANIEQTKICKINKLNKNRENYEENRSTGFIKNYKAVRHKEQPKFKKTKLNNIHKSNIKRPLKFSGMENINDGPTTDNN